MIRGRDKNTNVTQFSRSSEDTDVIKKHVFFTFCEHFDLKMQNLVRIFIF